MIFNWDTNLTDKEFLTYTNNPESPFFVEFAIRVLAMSPYREVFRKYLSVKVFIDNWKSVLEPAMKRNFLFSGQVDFWNEVWNFCKNRKLKNYSTL